MASNPYAYGRVPDILDQVVADAAAGLLVLNAGLTSARIAGYPGIIRVTKAAGSTADVNVRTSPQLQVDYAALLAAVLAAGDSIKAS